MLTGQDTQDPETDQLGDPAALEALVQEIRSGRAVAFVGAGFSRNFAPGWRDLLTTLRSRVDHTREGRQSAELMSGNPSSREFEAAAQLIREAYDHEDIDFDRSLSEAFSDLEEFSGGLDDGKDTAARDRDRLRNRIKWLDGIPFRAVLTTNFDGYLSDGKPPGPDVYAQVLRGDAAWWDAAVIDGSVLRAHRPVVELHGNARKSIDADDRSVVFTREQYLARVHGKPGYREFLKALLMTTTVVFLGFSFNDAYINGLRADVQSMFGSGDGKPPLAWAVMDGVEDQLADYLQRHERIGVVQLGRDIPGDFDRVLQHLYEHTNALRRVRELLKDKRVVWIDSQPENNEYGRRVLAGDGDGDHADNADIVSINPDRGGSWADQLRRAPSPDLIVTHWGRGESGTEDSRGIEVLKAIRSQDNMPSAPVIVFAAGGHPHVGSNRVAALAHGATSFETEWSGLFREISRLFDGVDRGSQELQPATSGTSSGGGRSA